MNSWDAYDPARACFSQWFTQGRKCDNKAKKAKQKRKWRTVFFIREKMFHVKNRRCSNVCRGAELLWCWCRMHYMQGSHWPLSFSFSLFSLILEPKSSEKYSKKRRKHLIWVKIRSRPKISLTLSFSPSLPCTVASQCLKIVSHNPQI